MLHLYPFGNRSLSAIILRFCFSERICYKTFEKEAGKNQEIQIESEGLTRRNASLKRDTHLRAISILIVVFFPSIYIQQAPDLPWHNVLHR